MEASAYFTSQSAGPDFERRSARTFQIGQINPRPREPEQEAIREMVALRAQGKALRAIAEAIQARGHRLSHEGVAGILTAFNQGSALRSP